MKKNVLIVFTAIFMLCTLGCGAYANDESWKENKVEVDLSNIKEQYNISQGGIYTLSGNYEGMIYVNTNDKVKLVLNNANITNNNNPAVFFDKCEKSIIETVEGTNNTLTDGTEYSVNAKGCIFSNADLDIQGEGTLTVNANYNHGIVSDDDIDIESGTVVINSKADGIHANNDIDINSGIITINSEEDGIQAEKSVNINGGTINIEAKGEIAEDNKEEFRGGFNGERPQQHDGFNPSEMLEGQIPPEIPEGDMSDFIKKGKRPEFENSTKTETFAEAATETTTQGISSKGIKADENIIINDGTITVNSNDHCVKATGIVTINNGNINLTSNVGKGVKAESNLDVKGGTININAKDEGMESKAVMTIYNGNIDIVSQDDGLNAGGGSGDVMIKGTDEAEEHKIVINGGNIYINAKCDGIDSNGNLEFNGGNIIIDGPVSGGDGSIDFGGSSIVNGGTIFATASAGMVECPDGSENQNVINITLDETQKAGSKIQIKDSNGNLIAEKTPVNDFQNIIFSSNKININESYTVYVNDKACANLTITSKTTQYGNQQRGGFRGMGEKRGVEMRRDFDNTQTSTPNI